MTSSKVDVKRTAVIWTCGNFIFVQLPLKTVKMYWQTQLFFLKLPFRCGYSILRTVKRGLSYVFGQSDRTNVRKVILNFFNLSLTEQQKDRHTFHDIRKCSVFAASRLNSLDNRIGQCASEISIRKETSERQNKRICDIAIEESKLLIVVLSAIKHLKTLKPSSDVAEQYKIEDWSNFLKNLSLGSFPDFKLEEGMANVEAVLKEGYSKLQNQTEQMRKIIENKKQLENLNCDEFKKCKYFLIQPSSTPVHSSNNSEGIEDQSLVELSMRTLETVISLLNVENLKLKEQLKITMEQLEDLQVTSAKLKGKICELEDQVKEISGFLLCAESDRDLLQDKLSVLENMIEEEEIYLKDDISCDDSYNELFFTPREFRIEEVKHSTPVEDPDPFIAPFISTKSHENS